MPNYTLNVFELVKQNQIAKLSLEMQKQSPNAVALGDRAGWWVAILAC